MNLSGVFHVFGEVVHVPDCGFPVGIADFVELQTTDVERDARLGRRPFRGMPGTSGRRVGGGFAVATSGEYVLEGMDRGVALDGVVFAGGASFEEVVGHGLVGSGVTG